MTAPQTGKDDAFSLKEFYSMAAFIQYRWTNIWRFVELISTQLENKIRRQRSQNL